MRRQQTGKSTAGPPVSTLPQMDGGASEEEAEEEAEARAEREAAAAAEREAAAAMGRVELLEAMKRRFLDGEAAFDYSEIDAHSGYDDLQQEGRDLEERWFDDDD